LKKLSRVEKLRLIDETPARV